MEKIVFKRALQGKIKNVKRQKHSLEHNVFLIWGNVSPFDMDSGESMEIKLIDFGIAYSYDQTIEINKKLLQHPELLSMILQHEVEHIQNPSFFDTLRIDFVDIFHFKKHRLMSKVLDKKMLLQSNLPIWFQNGQININPFLAVFYPTIILLGFVILIIF